MEGTISIQEVLPKMKITIQANIPANPFSIQVRYTDGPKIGQIYTKPKVVPYRKTSRKNDSKKRDDFSYRLQEQDMLMLFDVTKNHPFSVPYWAIMRYEGRKVIHE